MRIGATNGEIKLIDWWADRHKEVGRDDIDVRQFGDGSLEVEISIYPTEMLLIREFEKEFNMVCTIVGSDSEGLYNNEGSIPSSVLEFKKR